MKSSSERQKLILHKIRPPKGSKYFNKPVYVCLLCKEGKVIYTKNSVSIERRGRPGLIKSTKGIWKHMEDHARMGDISTPFGFNLFSKEKRRDYLHYIRDKDGKMIAERYKFVGYEWIKKRKNRPRSKI